MIFPLENRIKIFSYLGVWVLNALFHALSLYGILSVSFGVLIADGFIHAGLGAGLGIALWLVIHFGNYGSFPVLQRLISFIALAVLAIVLWVGLGFLLNYLLFGEAVLWKLVPTTVLRCFVGLLLYLILIFLLQNKRLQSKEDAMEENLNSTTLILPEEDESQPSETDDLEQLERIVVKSGQKIHVIPLTDILYFQSYGDYVQIVTPKGTFLKEQTMKYFESHLPSSLFVRIHRSHIVNIEAISQIEQYAKQNQLIILKNGVQLKISTAGYKTLRQALDL